VSFRSPKRRLTRQRSGFSVSGSTTGGECKIFKTQGIKTDKKEIEFTFEKNVKLASSFGSALGFVAIGGYVHCESDLTIKINLSFESSDGNKFTEENSFKILRNRWNNLGVHNIFDISKTSIDGVILASVKITSESSISSIDFFGFELNSVDYYKNEDLKIPFNQHTQIYLPEIYYFKTDEAFTTRPIEYSKYTWTETYCIVVKSCNRCARFLPIDFENQLNDISFSLHCKQRAPCNHSTFSTYKILKNQCPKLYSGSELKTYYGYQLECKSCKKFYVNWPLNPLRNSTQHREDSLRRRAFEELAGKLLSREWVFHSFRLKNNLEFDEYIFKKFGKKCFRCSKPLTSRKEMALDHTFPIGMLWPLSEDATCLCGPCNSSKSDTFPIDFYPKDNLVELSKLTGITLEKLYTRPVNEQVLEILKTRVVWFFDTFLMNNDYQKIRDGKLTADNIFRSLLDVIKKSSIKLDLISEYEKIKKRKPKSITIS